MTNRRALLFLLLAAAVARPAPAADDLPFSRADSKDSLCLELPPPERERLPTAPGSRTRNPAWYLSIAQFRRISAKDKWFIVDVRGDLAFERVHIPGSLHVVLSLLKTTDALRGKRLLLVNEGRTYLELEDAMPELLKAGFAEVRILDGGLNRWAMEREGTRQDVLEKPGERRFLNKMPASDFAAEIVYSSWLVLDTSEKSDPKAPAIPGAVSIPFKPGAAGFATRVAEKVKAKSAKQPLYSALVADADASRYEAIEQALKPLHLRNVFYLLGGTAAYETAVKNRDLTLQSARSLARKKPRCQPVK